MKLSTRVRYGTMALLDITLHKGEGPVLLKDVAQRQQISLLYLSHLITPLVTAGIIRSTRGARGGVWLARPPEEVKLSEVVQLLDGSTRLVECVNDAKTCSRSDICVTRDIWGEVQQAIDGILEATTLRDLVERQKKKEQPVDSMYYI